MPVFEFTSPQGKTYEITGPEGSTKEQAFGILQKQIGAPSGPIKSGPDSIPGSIPMGAPVQEPSRGVLDIARGVVDAGAGLVSNAVVAPFAQAGGVVRSITGGNYGTQKGVQQGQEFASQLQSSAYQPRTEAGKEYLGKVGGFLESTGLQGVPGEQMFMAGKLAAPAAATVSKTAGNVAKAVPKAFKPDEQTLAIARKAKEFGIPLRPDMLSNNKIIRMIGEAAEQVPLSGSKAGARQEAFNKALIAQIGGDTKAVKLTPDVFASALNRSGAQIGAIYRKTTVKAEGLGPKLGSIAEEAGKFETSDNARIVNNYIAEINGKVKNGVIDGTAFRKLDSAIGSKIRSTPDGDLRNALRSVQEAMRDALDSSLTSDADKVALKTARTQYAKALDIEPLVAKSPTGDISAAGLMGRVTATGTGKSMMARGKAGDMGDLARVGQRFLKEPPSSGTMERAAAYGTIGAATGAGALAGVNPMVGLGLWGTSGAYNIFGPRLTDFLTAPPKR